MSGLYSRPPSELPPNPPDSDIDEMTSFTTHRRGVLKLGVTELGIINDRIFDQPYLFGGRFGVCVGGGDPIFARNFKYWQSKCVARTSYLADPMLSVTLYSHIPG